MAAEPLFNWKFQDRIVNHPIKAGQAVLFCTSIGLGLLCWPMLPDAIGTGHRRLDLSRARRLGEARKPAKASQAAVFFEARCRQSSTSLPF